MMKLLRLKKQDKERGALEECAECAEGMGSYADGLCDPLKRRIAELEGQRDVLLRCLEKDYGIKASWDGLRKLWHTERTGGDKSRYYEFFGSPEAAARTLAKACNECSEAYPCCECPLYSIVGSNVYESEILEWMRGDA